MRIKISSLAIVITEFDAIGEYNYGVVVSTCHLYLLSCAGYPLYNTESIIGQDVLRII